MNLSQTLDRVKLLDEKEKRIWLEQLHRLLIQFQLGVALHRPYRLLLDTNILLRMEEAAENQFNPGNLAVLTFFNFVYRQSDWTSDIILRPPVLFEFWRRSNVTTLKEYWPKFQIINSLFESVLEIQPLFEGIETFEQANHYMTKIMADEIALRDSLLKIEERDWHVSFIWNYGDGVAGTLGKDHRIHSWPDAVADKFTRTPKLKYFHKPVVERVLRNHIAARIYDNPKNDQAVLDKYRSHHNFSLKNFFRLAGPKKMVHGLADLDLFSVGNIASQFQQQAHHKYFPGTIPITIDKDLHQALTTHSDLSTHSMVFNGGQDPEDGAAMFMQAMFDSKRMNRATQRQKQFASMASDFFQTLADDLFPNKRGAGGR